MGQTTSVSSTDGCGDGSAPPHHTETAQMEVAAKEDLPLAENEKTPLLSKVSWDGKSVGSEEEDEEAKDTMEAATKPQRGALAAAGKQQSFRRRTTARRPSFRGSRGLVADAGEFYVLEPLDAIMPLVNGPPPKGTVVHNRPEPTVKSIPPFAPYRRMARHRSFHLYWLNEFRHWWKSSRLLVRLGGLAVFVADAVVWEQLTQANFLKKSGQKHAAKLAKHLGQGGPMHWFLQMCRPFTRTLRIVVAVWRWIEAAKPRRGEVGVEEGMAFMGNRCSRIIAKLTVDYFTRYMMIPLFAFFIEIKLLDKHTWHSEILLIFLGILRAVSPFAASFQGSRVGRVVTRQFFINAKHKWLPIQRIKDLNPNSADCKEPDEVSADASLLALSHQVATVLGREVDHSPEEDHMYRKRNAGLQQIGFLNIGCGSGGYCVYEYRRGLVSILLHVTPYGPSIADQLPRYIVLEREDSVDMRSKWSNFVSEYVFRGPNVIEGYCYQGAFFSPYQFACMKERYDAELLCYDIACKKMCGSTKVLAKPPTDLPSLKAFLEIGRRDRDRKKGRKRYHQLQGQVDLMAKHIRSMMETKMPDGSRACTAPRGVILYFEGLDCAGKSSTGGLVQQALERAGFDVGMRQYNRPPTPEQKLQPWMDRFEKPDISVSNTPSESGDVEPKGNCEGHTHRALVWDRGPAGDFVYGTLASADPTVKLERYKEFQEFDAQCRREGILFCKLFFVTNRDAIAATLGKRLAQKKICRDLHTWLDASHEGEMFREGLAEVDMHIDPTDFVAFNSYQKNLDNFSEVVRHTDEPLNEDDGTNPWIVVNTGHRHSARVGLMKAFDLQLKSFKVSTLKKMSCFCCATGNGQKFKRSGSMEERMDQEFKRTLSLRTSIFFMALIVIIFYYCSNTYHFGEDD